MISIRYSTLAEKRKVYEWLCFSDITSMCMGEPDYPENPAPTWEQYLNDFEDFYFIEEEKHLGSVMIIEKEGEEIGCICHNNFHMKPNCTELDIWMKSKAYCGKGYGTEA